MRGHRKWSTEPEDQPTVKLIQVFSHYCSLFSHIEPGAEKINKSPSLRAHTLMASVNFSRCSQLEKAMWFISPYALVCPMTPTGNVLLKKIELNTALIWDMNLKRCFTVLALSKNKILCKQSHRRTSTVLFLINHLSSTHHLSTFSTLNNTLQSNHSQFTEMAQIERRNSPRKKRKRQWQAVPPSRVSNAAIRSRWHHRDMKKGIVPATATERLVSLQLDTCGWFVRTHFK